MKYIIAKTDWDEIVGYHAGVFINTRNEAWLFKTARSLRCANIYDTRKDAQDEVDRLDPDLSEHNILAVPGKEIFEAKLKGK